MRKPKPVHKDVRIVFLKDDHASEVSGNCGWVYRHKRVKVREAAAQRHLDKHHGGLGAWL